VSHFWLTIGCGSPAVAGGPGSSVASGHGDSVAAALMSIADPAADLRPLNAVLPTRQYLAAMWARRDFAIALPLEEVRSTHQDTLLGNLWHLANPMLSVAVYYLVFGVMLDVSRGVDNYILWLMIGVFAFNLTSRCVLGGATSISSNQGLMRSIRFPRALLPFSVIVSKLMTFGFELAVLGVVALATGEGISWRWAVLPLVVVLHSGLNLGGAFVTARLNDSFRDIQQIIPFLFRLLMYVSGVMFPLDTYLTEENAGSILPELIRLNPLIGILDMYRWVFLGEPVYDGDLIKGVAGAVVLLIFGFWFFRSAEPKYGRA
jgi:teichoic acid transport system permease protein